MVKREAGMHETLSPISSTMEKKSEGLKYLDVTSLSHKKMFYLFLLSILFYVLSGGLGQTHV